MPIFLWFSYASAQFEGATAKWLKSFKHSFPKAGWEEFCIALLAHFGRNQHATLLQRMFHICQITIVDAYVEEFSQLMDQLSAYGRHPDPLYYVTRFMDGLKPAVRLMVAIQLPENLEIAYQLALLHEELGDGSTPFNIDLAPRRYAAPISPAAPVRVLVERAPAPLPRQAVDDKWVALHTYRRAKGLCYTCGERGGKEHKFHGSVQLHIVQELVDLL
jgi:hypothetical protein